MKVETYETTYRGTYKDGIKYENYLFLYGTKVKVSDLYVNARDIRSAVNKLARRLGLRTYGKDDLDELNDDIENGYYTIEEVNYYSEEDDTTYKYYVSAIYE